MTNQLALINRASILTPCPEDQMQLTVSKVQPEPVNPVKIVELTFSQADLFEADCVLCECMTLFAQWTEEEEEEVAIADPVVDFDCLVKTLSRCLKTLSLRENETTPAIEMAPTNTMASDATVSSTSQSSSSMIEYSASAAFHYPESDVDSSSSAGYESEDNSKSSASTVSSDVDSHLSNQIFPSVCDCCNDESDSDSGSSSVTVSTAKSTEPACISCQKSVADLLAVLDDLADQKADLSGSSSVTGVSTVPSAASSESSCSCCNDDLSSSVTSFYCFSTAQSVSSPTSSDDGVLQTNQIGLMLAECEEMIEKTLVMRLQVKKLMEKNGWTEE